VDSYSVDPLLSAEARAKALERHPFTADLITWCAVHGNLQLALRHPLNQGASRPRVEQFVKDLGLWLVARGLLTPEILAEAQRREREFSALPRPERP
jgi:hypothetical protein